MEKNNELLKSIFKCLILISPILFLTIRHSINTILFILFIASIVYLRSVKNKINTIKKYKLTLFVFISPIIAVLISQILRFELEITNWDSPLRFALCMIVYMAIVNGATNNRNSAISTSQIWLCYSIPLALVFTGFSRAINPSENWGKYKTTYFVDPLTFGSYSLLFALLVIIGLVFFLKKLSKLHALFNIISVVIGMYLSITSGARTGWISFPILLILIFILTFRLHNIKWGIILSVLILLIITIIIIVTPEFYLKFILGFKEIHEFNYNNTNIGSSVGDRLAFIKMGMYYFFDRPLTGWGDLSWLSSNRINDFRQFANELTIIAPMHGFHNEILTNSVRSGIWGLISSASLFISGYWAAVKGMKMKINENHFIISVLLFVITIHLFFAGLSTEITNLTFLSAFIGIVYALLYGEKAYYEENIERYKNGI